VARQGKLDVRDADFRLFVIHKGNDPDQLIAELVQRRLLAWSDNHTVRLITTTPFFIGFTPDGQVLTTNEANLLDLWMREPR
jgi:hypothetical protein